MGGTIRFLPNLLGDRNMKLNEALDVLAQVCAVHTGNLKEHQILQEALKTVGEKCNAITKDEEKDESPPETTQSK